MFSAQRTLCESRALGTLAWSSQYLALSRDAAFIDGLAERGWVATPRTQAPVWTNDRASLLLPMLRHRAAR
jgi:hypothetical protein